MKSTVPIQRVEAIRWCLVHLEHTFKIMKDGETEMLRKHAYRENLSAVSVKEADVLRQ